MASRLHRFLKKFSARLYIGWVLFIALITLIPGYSIPGNIDWNFLELDKLIHMTVFALMTYLGCYYYHNRGKSQNITILISLIPAILYGAAIELLQTFIPQRGFDYADLTADVIGAIIGVFAYRTFVFKKYQDS